MTNPKIVVDGKPAREFWIDPEVYNSDQYHAFDNPAEYTVAYQNGVRFVHVIEYSAYEDLLKRKASECIILAGNAGLLGNLVQDKLKSLREELESLRKKNETLVEKLKWIRASVQYDEGLIAAGVLLTVDQALAETAPTQEAEERE